MDIISIIKYSPVKRTYVNLHHRFRNFLSFEKAWYIARSYGSINNISVIFEVMKKTQTGDLLEISRQYKHIYQRVGCTLGLYLSSPKVLMKLNEVRKEL